MYIFICMYIYLHKYDKAHHFPGQRQGPAPSYVPLSFVLCHPWEPPLIRKTRLPPQGFRWIRYRWCLHAIKFFN